jgi:hypothetical protein
MKGVKTLFVLLAALAGPAAAQTGKGSGADARFPATVVVLNQLEGPVTIWINGEMKGRVEPAGRMEFHRIPAGQISLQAGAAGSAGPVASEERAIASGETFTWTLFPVLSWGEEKGTGTLVLTNALERDVDVALNGNPAGRLGPGATRAYPRVVAGEVVVSARGADGDVLEEHRLSVTMGGIARWKIGSREDASATRAEAGS